MSRLLAISTWSRPESRFQTLLGARTAALVGVAGAIVTVAVAGLPAVGLAIGCVSVVLLFSCYTVFSFAWGERNGRAAEAAFALVGVLTVVLAVAVDPRWLAFGWAMHAGWDLLHHRDHHVVGLRGIPLWWVQGCVVWDLLAATGIVLAL